MLGFRKINKAYFAYPENNIMTTKKRKLVQWLLSPLVLIVIIFGWKYPWLGFTVPIVMFIGLIGGVLRGRYVCGNVCPRGAFFDRVIAQISFKRGIPEIFRNTYLRIALFVLLIGLLGYRISRNPTEIEHWGRVFWLMCTLTTIVGIVLGIIFHQRSWCVFCPVGSLQNWVGGNRYQLRIDKEKCVECHLCEKTCPLRLPILSYKGTGIMAHRDCLKCSECIAVCLKKALSWPTGGSNFRQKGNC